MLQIMDKNRTFFSSQLIDESQEFAEVKDALSVLKKKVP